MRINKVELVSVEMEFQASSCHLPHQKHVCWMRTKMVSDLLSITRSVFLYCQKPNSTPIPTYNWVWQEFFFTPSTTTTMHHNTNSIPAILNISLLLNFLWSSLMCRRHLSKQHCPGSICHDDICTGDTCFVNRSSKLRGNYKIGQCWGVRGRSPRKILGKSRVALGE